MTTAPATAQCVDLLDPVETEVLRAYFDRRTKLRTRGREACAKRRFGS